MGGYKYMGDELNLIANEFGGVINMHAAFLYVMSSRNVYEGSVTLQFNGINGKHIQVGPDPITPPYEIKIKATKKDWLEKDNLKYRIRKRNACKLITITGEFRTDSSLMDFVRKVCNEQLNALRYELKFPECYI